MARQVVPANVDKSRSSTAAAVGERPDRIVFVGEIGHQGPRAVVPGWQIQDARKGTDCYQTRSPQASRLRSVLLSRGSRHPALSPTFTPGQSFHQIRRPAGHRLRTLLAQRPATHRCGTL